MSKWSLTFSRKAGNWTTRPCPRSLELSSTQRTLRYNDCKSEIRTTSKSFCKARKRHSLARKTKECLLRWSSSCKVLRANRRPRLSNSLRFSRQSWLEYLMRPVRSSSSQSSNLRPAFRRSTPWKVLRSQKTPGKSKLSLKICDGWMKRTSSCWARLSLTKKSLKNLESSGQSLKKCRTNSRALRKPSITTNKTWYQRSKKTLRHWKSRWLSFRMKTSNSEKKT